MTVLVLIKRKSIKMNLIKLALFFFFGFLLNSCSTDNNKIFWVSGVKSDCTAGEAKMQCLNVHKGENIENASWENFYSSIEGFEYEEGYLHKIEVKESKIDESKVPADGESLKYELVKVIDKQKDMRTELNGDWVLYGLNDAPLTDVVNIPTMSIDLSKEMLSAFGGCNNFTAEIESLTSSQIQLRSIAQTNRACINENAETGFQAALNSIKAYQLKDDMLNFKDADGKNVLTFSKVSSSKANQRMHDIWIATRIDGNPVNRTLPVPRLEINLTKMKVMGSDGCNDFQGAIQEVAEEAFFMGNIASTKKMCPEMETANAFNKALNQVASYKLDGLNLMLKDASGKEVLAFLKGD